MLIIHHAVAKHTSSLPIKVPFIIPFIVHEHKYQPLGPHFLPLPDYSGSIFRMRGSTETAVSPFPSNQARPWQFAFHLDTFLHFCYIVSHTVLYNLKFLHQTCRRKWGQSVFFSDQIKKQFTRIRIK